MANKLIYTLIEEIAVQRENLFLWAPVFLGTGTGIYFLLKSEPPLWPAGMAAGVLFCSLLLLRSRQLLRIPFLLAFLVVLGFFAAQVRTMMVAAPQLSEELGPVQVTGTIKIVDDLEEGSGQRLLLDELQIENLEPPQTPEIVRLTIKKNDDYRPGQRVVLLAQLNPPSPPVLPGAFDFRRHMYYHRIGAVGFVYKKIETVRVENRLADFLEKTRNLIAARIKAVIRGPAAPLSVALVTGQRTGISEADNEAMRNSGLYHLISISGLHIGLFSAFIFFVSRFAMVCIPGFALTNPVKKYAAVLGFLAAVFYALLAGFSIPTQRSLIMAGMAYAAILLDRSPFSLRMVAFAAFVVILCTPDSLVSASFQMSFAAVTALVAAFDALRPRLIEWNRQAGWLRKSGLYVGGVCFTTIIATLATAPFSLFHFQQLALYGLLGNALAVPLTSFAVMPAIVLALLLIPLHLEYLPLKVLEKSVEAVLVIAREVAALPYSSLHVSAWPQEALVYIICGFILFVLWQGWMRWMGMVPVIVAVAIIFSYKQPDIFVSSEFGVAGYRTEDGSLRISGRKKERFSIENWERMLGLEEGSAVAWPKESAEAGMTCDTAACRLELKGRRISFVRNPEVKAQECGWADAVLSFSVLGNRECEGKVLIDKFDVLHNGAHAVWLKPDGIVVRNVGEVTGARPWGNY